MTLLDHFLREEQSYWSMQALLRKAICKGKWVLLYGSRVVGFSENKDELLKHFSKNSEKLDPRHHLPGAIYVKVGEEEKFYRIRADEEQEEPFDAQKEIH